MKSVGFIIHSLAIMGGVGSVVNKLANELCKNYNVHIIAIQDESIYESYSFAPEIQIRFLRVKETSLRKQQLYALPKIKQYVKKNHIDVLFAEGTYSGYIVAAVRFFSKTKLVFCDHGAFLSQYNDRKTRYIRKIASFLCHYTIVLTERSRDDYIHYFHMKPSKIQCIYNWIDEEIIESGSRNKYDANSTMILSAGRFSPEKGYDLLVEVAKKVLPKHKDWKWYVYGDGETYEEIATKKKEAGLDEQLILPGAKNNLQQEYLSAAILVLPSRREGMPLVLLEGKGYKIPMVSFDVVSGPKEIINDGINGFLVKAEDINGMAEAIDTLITDKELRIKMSNRSYDDIDRFSKEKITQIWISFIESIVKK